MSARSQDRSRANDGSRPRSCENSKLASFRVSLYPSRTASKPIRGDLASRVRWLARSGRVFTRPRPTSDNRDFRKRPCKPAIGVDGTNRYHPRRAVLQLCVNNSHPSVSTSVPGAWRNEVLILHHNEILNFANLHEPPVRDRRVMALASRLISTKHIVPGGGASNCMRLDGSREPVIHETEDALVLHSVDNCQYHRDLSSQKVRATRPNFGGLGRADH